MAGEVGGHGVDVIGEISPGTRHTFYRRLTAQFAVGADFAGHAADFAGKRVELVDHCVHGVLQGENLALDFDGDLGGKVTLGDGGGNIGDVADLPRQVGRHEVHVVREIFPGTRDAWYLGLAAQLAFGANLARDAADLAGKGVELVDHRVDGVLQLENFALDLDGDFAAEIAARHGGGDVRDISNLRGEVVGHGIDVVRQILPGAGHVSNLSLSAQLALCAHLTRHARDFGGERVELIDHRVESIFELENFALNVDGNFLGQVAVGHRGGHGGDVANLAREI